MHACQHQLGYIQLRWCQPLLAVASSIVQLKTLVQLKMALTSACHISNTFVGQQTLGQVWRALRRAPYANSWRTMLWLLSAEPDMLCGLSQPASQGFCNACLFCRNPFSTVKKAQSTRATLHAAPIPTQLMEPSA